MRHWTYVLKLLRFAFKANPLLYLSICVSLLSVAVELLAMLSLFPLFQLVSTGKPPAGSFIVQLMGAVGIPATGTAMLWTFIALLMLRIITQILGQTLSMFLGKRVLAQLGSRAFEQIMHRLSIREVNDKSIGFYIGLAGDESFRASTLILSLTEFVNTAALASLYFVAIAMSSPNTAGVVLIFLVSSSLALLGVFKASHRLGARQTMESRRAHSIFLDSLNNLKAVRAFSAEKYVVDLYRSIIFGYTRILFLIDELSLLARLLPVLLLLIIFGGWLALSSQSIESTSLSVLVTMIVYLMRFFPAVGDAAKLLFKIVSDAKSGKDVTAILGVEPAAEPASWQPLSAIETIRLSDVGFSYEQNGGREILAGVHCTFERGMSYALIGRSGTGKSTLVDILLKFYQPTTGSLHINDTPMSQVPDREIRRNVILVSQDASMFDDSVANNVRLGLQADQERVRTACKIACIDDVVSEMTQGYDTRLQYQGKNLSGGQRQRIAIARAVLRDPQVLILDESTSALDKTTQQRIIDNILNEFRDRIVIFVTHDPYIMKRVDVVVDLEAINFRALGSESMPQATSEHSSY